MSKHYGIRPIPDPIEVKWSIRVDKIDDGQITLHIEGDSSGPQDLLLQDGDTVSFDHTVSFT